MDLYPIKAQYLRNEEITLRLELQKEKFDYAVITVYMLEKEAAVKEIRPLLDVTDICFQGFDVPFAGYGVEAVLYGECGRVTMETAFDVTDNPKSSLRYGFVSDFEEKDAENGAIDQLRKYHINMVQFYDWSYRHDTLVSPNENYQDMMGKRIDFRTVRSKIKSAAGYGMKTMAYGAVYAASREFYESHKDWAFYNGNQEVFRFIDVFYIMNVEKESPWRNHLIHQYKDAIMKAGFSGIHMDTYGFPKRAYSHLQEQPRLVRLDQEFCGLIDDTRKGLEEAADDPCLVFNNVGNWPVGETAKSTVDAVYIEVWSPYDRYCHIKQLIQEAKYFSENKKPVILAAYLAPFRTESDALAANAAYILTAAIVSNGGYHLLLGENNAVLTQGYYGNYSTMPDETAAVMRKYYDFMIRYLNIFYGQTLQDVSMTHIGWDNYEYQCGFQNWSVNAEAGKVWITIRENEELKCLYLINLCGCGEDNWNKGKAEPIIQKDLTFTVNVDGDIQGIYCASPDRDSCKSELLEYSYIQNEKGKFVTFTVAELSVWTVVYLKL